MMIQSLKERFEVMGTVFTKQQNLQQSLEAAQRDLKGFKHDCARKSEIIKHHCEKITTLETELNFPEGNIKSTEALLQRYASRELQFKKIFEKLIILLDSRAKKEYGSFTELSEGLDVHQVEEMAQKISSKYLKMDWIHLLEKTKPPSVADQFTVLSINLKLGLRGKSLKMVYLI